MRAIIALASFALFPVSSHAGVAGTWEGALKFPAQTVRFVLHISGTDDHLTTTFDSPDQGAWGFKVDSITLSGPVLTFIVRRGDIAFAGNLMSDGTIVGTFTQHGTGIPLVLARSAGVSHTAPETASDVTVGIYKNDWTGIEFNVPERFKIIETETRSNPTGLQVDVAVPDTKNARVAVWMNKRTMFPQNISANLNVQIPAKIRRRGGAAVAYTISQNSIQRLQIGGQQAIRATAYFTQQGMKMSELLAWISSEQSIVHFYAIVPADEADNLQPAFDQMVMSARVP